MLDLAGVADTVLLINSLAGRLLMSIFQSAGFLASPTQEVQDLRRSHEGLQPCLSASHRRSNRK